MTHENKIYRKRVAIIGGGATGLIAAYLLSPDFEITVYEKENEIGGLLSTIEISDLYLEKYYHHLFRNDKDILRLFKKLGLKVNWHKDNAGFFYKKFYPANGLSDFLKLGFLSFFDRIKLIAGIVLIQFNNKGNISDCGKRCFGAGGFRKVWQKMIKDKFGPYYPAVKNQWLANRLRKRIVSGQKLGYPEGGFDLLLKKIVKEILANRGQIILGCNISAVSKKTGTYSLNNQEYDIIISTLPHQSLTEIYKTAVVEISPYLGCITGIYDLSRKLNYYWLNILDSKVLNGLVNQKLMLQNTNKNIVYAVKYLDTNSPQFKISDEEIADQFSSEIKRVTNLDGKMIGIFRTKYAQPVQTKKSDIIVKIDTNFYSATMENIFPDDRGLNNSVRQAQKLKEILCEN